MNEQKIEELKKSIVAIGRLLWEKDLATGLNGNISTRLDDDTILITATQTCLGLLHTSDIVVMKLDGTVVGEGKASTETLMHTDTYKEFPETKAIVHTHTVYTNGYFLENQIFTPRIFEAKCYLGTVEGIDQTTPAVTDMTPVRAAFKKNDVVVLRNHGVVAKGRELFNCFVLIQGIEEAIKTEFVAKTWAQSTPSNKPLDSARGKQPATSPSTSLGVNNQ